MLAYVDMRLVVGRVCQFDEMPLYWIMLPLLIGFFNAGGRFIDETVFVYAYLVYVVLAEIHAGFIITTTLCNHLNVKLFVIPDKRLEKKN